MTDDGALLSMAAAMTLLGVGFLRASVSFRVTCDAYGCAKRGPLGRTVEEAKQSAVDQGWTHRPGSQESFCPRHAHLSRWPAR